MAAAMLLLVAAPAAAQDQAPSRTTAAGTLVSNVATITVSDADGSPHQFGSNPVVLTVAERLDVALTGATVPVALIAGDTAAVAVTLANRGNGDEPFVVVADAASPRVVVTAIAIDRDGDGLYDPAADTLLADGTTPPLAPGATLSLLVVLHADGVPASGDRLVVTARAATASGTPGTVASGRGDGGGDAVVGTTGASVTVSRAIVTVADTAPTLSKAVTFRAPDGSARAVSGGEATYVLTASFAQPATTAQVDDVIPTGTLYRAGSLMLDDAALSDAADDDAGQADAGAIAVTLGPVVTAETHTIRFTVTLP